MVVQKDAKKRDAAITNAASLLWESSTKMAAVVVVAVSVSVPEVVVDEFVVLVAVSVVSVFVPEVVVDEFVVLVAFFTTSKRATFPKGPPLKYGTT